MTDRLPAEVMIGALLRRANDAGGMAMVRARGDAKDGALLLILYEKGQFSGIFQREPGIDGQSRLARIGPDAAADAEAVEAYWQRRRLRDPDLWVVELDIAQVERFAAETVALD